jgi:putative endonuclease
LGALGERAAAKYLRERGYRVLIRNYRCPAGEIDLICREGATLVFVEVKTRTQFARESPAEAAPATQWKRIDRAAKYFLRQRNVRSCPCRLDLITVEWASLHSVPRIEHFVDAYAALAG